MKPFYRWFLFLLILSTSTAAAQNLNYEKQARSFVNELARGDYAAIMQHFDATMRSELPEEKLKQIWQGLIAQTGEFQRQGRVFSQAKGPYTMVNVACIFAQTSLDCRVVFDQNGKISGLFFLPLQDAPAFPLPDYAKPKRYTEKELSFGKEPWILPATLTLPRTEEPVPAVVLVHGSGPNDRDETIGGNKVFRDIALGLASRGIAVLRYDKRTLVHGRELDPATLTLQQEVIDDALAAVRLLRAHPAIDSSRVFVLGHSLGGMSIPRIAAADKKIAGFIIMAGPTRPLYSLLQEQYTYIFSLDSVISPLEQEKLDQLQQQIATLQDSLALHNSAAKELPLGLHPAYWQDMLAYDIRAAAREITAPVLVLQGGRDYQVSLADFEGWKQALSRNPLARFILYDDLNHLFISGSGRSTPAEYQQSGHVSVKVIEDIARWISEIP